MQERNGSDSKKKEEGRYHKKRDNYRRAIHSTSTRRNHIHH
jgi:hypothetical protein